MKDIKNRINDMDLLLSEEQISKIMNVIFPYDSLRMNVQFYKRPTANQCIGKEEVGNVVHRAVSSLTKDRESKTYRHLWNMIYGSLKLYEDNKDDEWEAITYVLFYNIDLIYRYYSTFAKEEVKQ